MVDVNIGSTENSETNFLDVIDWIRTKGVQGDEKNALIILNGLLYGNSKKERLHLGVEGFTGSGKSAMTDLFLNHEKYEDDILFPPELIFVASGGSDKSFVRNSHEFRDKMFIYIEEFQKLAKKEELLENIKNLSENKKVKYMLPTGETFTIDKGKTVVYCLAINNDYKKDAETTRRFIKVDTDISKDLTKRVIESKLDRNFYKEENVFITPEREAALKKHIRDCLTFRVLDIDFRNPFFSKKNAKIIPIPDTNIRSYVDYFLRMMEASAIFHHKKRTLHNDNLFVNLQDIYNVVRIFGEQFLRDVHGLPPYAEYVLESFNHLKNLEGTEAKKMGTLDAFTDNATVDKATASDIHRAVIECLGIMLDYHTVKDIMNVLTDLNFLVIDTTGKKSLYSRTNRVFEPLDIDFKALYEHGKENMLKKYPELYPQWIQQNDVALYDPLTGETVKGLPHIKVYGAIVKDAHTSKTEHVDIIPSVNASVEMVDL